MEVSKWNYASVDLGENRNGELFETSPTTSSRTMHHNPRLDELFKACDTKGRGVIGPVEFRELCDKFGISPTDSDVIFADLDHDGDGNIDFGDFSHGFRDFLTPGSRRGSLQVSPVADSSSSNQQLLEMEKKHASAKTAWKHFVTNVGTSNLHQFISNNKEQLSGITEEIRSDDGKRNDIPPTLENALTSLIMDVQHLHEEYKTLESTFRKEREVHAAQLVALGEELDQQLAKAEAKAKAEARQEAQRQMDTERKKIASEIENQLADLSSQIRTFQKVEEWLAEEEERETKRVKAPEDQSKLHEAESENRNLRSALVEAQMKATLLQTQLTEKRNEYLDLFSALHTEKQAASEYKSQVNLMQNHLVVLSEANRVLSDANDCLSTQLPSNMSGFSPPSSLSISAQQEGETTLASQSNNSCPTSLGILETLESPPVKQSSSDPRIPLVPSLPFFETDRDSGRSTLLEELRAEGDGSPLPSGIWTCSSSSSPPPPPTSNSLQQQDLLAGKRSGDGCVSSGKWPTSQNGIGPGKLGSSCFTQRGDERSGSGSSSPQSRNRRNNPPPAEATYKSYEFGEDGSQDLYEALSPVAAPAAGGSSGHMGERLSQNRSDEDYEEEERLPPHHHHHESSASSSTSAASFYPHRTFKVILAGDAAVGKTTFIERICHGHFTPNLSSTIGVDFRVKTIELDGKCVALQLWDTAGQERFRSLTKSYFRRADGVILMYDVSNERTFANIRNWINNVEEGAGRTVPIVLSGNKVDLREDGKWPRALHDMCVTQEDGEKLARQCGAIFVETSPKTGHNVFEALMMLAKEMSQVEDAELRNSLQLSENSEEKMKKKGCCGGGSSPAAASGTDGESRKGRTSPNGH